MQRIRVEVINFFFIFLSLFQKIIPKETGGEGFCLHPQGNRNHYIPFEADAIFTWVTMPEIPAAFAMFV